MKYKAGDVVKIDKTRFVIERVTKKRLYFISSYRIFRKGLPNK